MLAWLFQCVRLQNKRVLIRPLRRYHVRNLRRSAGDCTRLVESHNLHLARFLKRGGSLKHYAVFCPHAVTDHNSDRRCKTERARTAYHKHRNAPCKRKAHAVARHKPNQNRDYRYNYDRRHEHARHLVGDFRNRSFCRRRVAHHLYYLRKRRVLAHAQSLAFDKARLIYSRRGNPVAHRLVNRDALTRKRGLIDRACPLKHNAVNGNALTRTDDKDIPL